MLLTKALHGPLSCGIYKIDCVPTGKSYVGSAVNFVKRWRTHINCLRKGTHHSRPLQNAWNKYGEAAFAFTRLFVCKKEDLIFFEQRALDALEPAFNIAKIANSALGLKRSDESKRRISVSKMGNTCAKGYKHTPETVELIRQRMRSRPSPFLSWKRTQDVIDRVAEKHRGMKRSAETKLRISEAKIGVKLPPRSPETTLKLSLALRGKGALTNDQVRDIRKATGGRGLVARLGEKYEVTYSLISMIRSRKRYGWVPDNE